MKHNLLQHITAFLLAFGCAATTAFSITFKPTSDDQILEILPRSVLLLADPNLAALKQQAHASPSDPTAAAAVATKLIDVGRATGDPRMYGQAQAAIAPWWGLATPPPAVLALRAAIRQYNHEFPAALADLEQYLKEAPSDAQARLMQATVLQVTGDYAGERAACRALSGRLNPLVPITCNASVDSFTGTAPAAFARLVAVSNVLGRRDPAIHAWALSTAGDIAVRLGKSDQALDLLRTAHAEVPGDIYTAAQLADVLLDRGAPAEALVVAQDRPDQDALLLRQTLAEQRLGLPAAVGHVAMMVDRFAAERARGTTPHLREESYFELQCRGNSSRALALATENWQSQREPIDARLLLEAGAAAGDARAAQPALAWLQATGTQEPHMLAARAKLEGK